MRSPSNNEGHEIEKFLKKCFDINKKYIHLWTVVPKDCPPSTIQTNIGFKNSSMNSYAKAVIGIATLVGFERFWRKRIQTSKTKMKTCSETSKNTSRTQVDMVFDIRKIFRIRRKNFVK